MKTLYLVESSERVKSYPSICDALGPIRNRLPQVSLHLSVLPIEGTLQYACDLVRYSRSAGMALGFILISCPREVYRLFADTETPTVVLSDVYAETNSLTSIDGDQALAGRLLAKHLLQTGHKRIALISHSVWLAGDNHFLDGITEELAAAGLPQGSLVVRSVRDDVEEITNVVTGLCSSVASPTGFICRTWENAELVSRVSTQAVGSTPEIVFGVTSGRLPTDCRFPYVYQREMSEHIQVAIDTLGRLNTGECSQGEHIRAPVNLVLPPSKPRKSAPAREVE